MEKQEWFNSRPEAQMGSGYKGMGKFGHGGGFGGRRGHFGSGKFTLPTE